MQKAAFQLVAVLLLGCQAGTTQSPPRETPREVEFAQKVILGNWVLAKSASARAGRDRCGDACPETGTVEMGIGLLGAGGNATTRGLLNLLSVRFDADASEELQCQFANRGQSIVAQLQRLDAASTSTWCHQTFAEARRQELSNISDVPVADVCRTPSEIDKERKQILGWLKSSEGCEY